MKRIALFLIIGISLFCSGAISQDVINTLNFSGFEPYLNRKSDTVYVINFWATWCGPCRKELPDIEQIHLDYLGKKVKVLLVSLDFPSSIREGLIPYIKSNNITAEVLLLNDPDSNSWIGKVDPSWSGALPATLIYKKNKRVFFNTTVNYQIIDTELSGLLN